MVLDSEALQALSDAYDRERAKEGYRHIVATRAKPLVSARGKEKNEGSREG